MLAKFLGRTITSSRRFRDVIEVDRIRLLSYRLGLLACGSPFKRLVVIIARREPLF